MILRLVRMGFREDKIPGFLEFFEQSRDQIRSSPGCLSLDLFRDREHPGVFFTISRWLTPEALEQYRNSEWFHLTWAHTKSGFREKPLAWTLDPEFSGIPDPAKD